MQHAATSNAGSIPFDRTFRFLHDDLETTRWLHHFRGLAAQSRLAVLDMIYRAGSGHVASSLSCVDLITVLKFDQMDWDARRPRQESDVFVLSKGHAVPAWYAALMVAGELDRAEAGSLRRIDSRLQGHPDRRHLDLVDVSTGALGQGLSVAIGRAEAKRLKGQNTQVYCVLGDGELQEGQVWEAFMYAGARRVGNVVAFIDYNKGQSDGPLDEIMPLEPLCSKLRAFRWHVQEIDGHSHFAIRDAIVGTKADTGRPSVIVAHTRKGYLGGGQVLLDGSHSAGLGRDDYAEATRYLEAVA
jgi:transketolase